MTKTILLLVLFFTSLFAQACNSTKADIALPKIESAVNDSGKVNFKGVSFRYDPQIFGEVEAEEVAASPLQYETDKPDGVLPQHILFKLKTTNRRAGRIGIYPIEDFRRIWKLVEKNNTIKFDNELNNLKKAIKDKNFRRNGEVPYLVYYDAHQTFTAKVKHFSFQNGRGVLFLTEIDHEASLINNEGLTYYFQGLTADGKNYILAEFPVKVSFLPDSWEANEFEDYKLSSYYKEGRVKEYEEYISKITKRLENLPADKYEPNLKYIEEIISSLKVEN